MLTTTRWLLLAFALSQTGCVALLDAAFKEGNDHGRHARYENKSFGEHFLDSLVEEDDDCEDRCRRCDQTTVIVHHH